MTLDELQKIVNDLDSALIKKYGLDIDLEKRVLARMVKTTEELGELCDEALSFCNLQHGSKLDKYKKEYLENEFADVLLSLLLFAKLVDIDVEEAVKRKFKISKEKIENDNWNKK